MTKTKIISFIFTLIASIAAQAQSIEGTTYYLPKAMMRFTVKVEKTVYTPGQFAPYARRYMKKDVSQDAATSYRIIGIEMAPQAVPDTSKRFTLLLEKKTNITKVCQADNGQLLAINADVKAPADVHPIFTPAPKTPLPNPNDYMTEDILRAGNIAKMAELTAQEIYDIRDSRNQLSRGEADFMPKDGAQLQLMLNNLSMQERALVQLFEGTNVKDTTWTTIDYIPTKDGQDILFRFSKYLGLLDNDDLAGAPYYINVKDNRTVTAPAPAPIDKKEDKNNIGLCVNNPSKITVTVQNDRQVIGRYEVSAPQFGYTESLSGELFGKKQTSKVILDPLTGSIQQIEAITM